MLINNTAYKDQYTPDGNTVAFPITFPFFENSQVKVYYSPEGSEEANLVESTTYTITGAGSESGGTLTFTTPPEAGITIAILRDMPITQTYEYTELDNFPAESHENALAKLTMICQELKEETDRSIKVPATSTDPAEDYAVQMFEASAAAQQSASAAATSATAAATSVTNAATSEQAAASSAITAQTWAESETPPDPDDAESKSAKAWALSAAANVPFASTTYAGKVMASTSLYVNQETGEATVPAASETLAGIARQATNAEAAAGTVNGAVFVKPSHLAALNAFRLSRIGVPVPVASSTLDDSFKLADGSLVLFADYPELHARYVAQKLLVLSSTVSTASKASHPLYFVLNANNTGLYLPRLSGLFMRAWVGTSSGSTGGHNSAGLPNITGTIEHLVSTSNGGGTSPNGAFAWTYAADVNPGRMVATPDVAWKFNPQFKASQSNSIYGKSTTVMPESYNQPIAIYLGQPA